MAKNAEFAANSQTYKDVVAEVDREAATKGITLSPEERKAKINEKLSQISATTTNAASSFPGISCPIALFLISSFLAFA